MKLNKLIIVLTLFFACCSFISCNKANIGLNPKDFAPDFTLKNLKGEEVELSNYRGKTVLLNFWASWCVPCVEEAPSLQALYEKLESKDFVIVAVAIDDQEEDIKNFANKFGLTFPILIDKTSKVARKYKVTGYPETFIIDKMGQLKVLINPINGMPEVRIVGPRDWLDKDLINEILK